MYFKAGNNCKLFAKSLAKKKELNLPNTKVLWHSGLESLMMKIKIQTKGKLMMGFYL